MPLIIFLLTLCAIFGAYLLNGLALYYLWEWFLVPLGLRSISVSWAIGIATIVGLITAQYSKPREEDKNEAAIYVFIRPVFALLVGWICKEIAF